MPRNEACAQAYGERMRRWATWLLVGGLAALAAIAVADAVRGKHQVHATQPTTISVALIPRNEPAASAMNGVLVIAGPGCSVAALRLPGLDEENPPRPPDCNGVVWSDDASLAARCTPDNGTEILTADLAFTARVQGCAPAWRSDGALSVIHNGDVVIWRRRGQPRVLLSRQALARALAGRIEGAADYKLVELSWHGTVAFFGIVAGRKPWQRAVVAYAPEGLNDVIPELGQDISDLQVSPSGSYVAFSRLEAGRQMVMLAPSGQEVPLPGIGNARALAWSPDERWVAIATRTTTFIARLGSRQAVMQIQRGGDSLDWLP
jgi:hypothetical protein